MNFIFLIKILFNGSMGFNNQFGIFNFLSGKIVIINVFSDFKYFCLTISDLYPLDFHYFSKWLFTEWATFRPTKLKMLNGFSLIWKGLKSNFF